MDAAAEPRALIEGLCSFEGRWPGTDAERRAAGWLAERLQAMGRPAQIEPTYVHPEYSLVIALHAVLAVAGGLIATAVGPLGFAMVLVAAVSLYLDQNTRLYLIRRLFFRRASQNVVSPGSRPDAPARLVLTAHYDAARTGYVFGERSLRLSRRLSPPARLLLGPIRLIFWGGIAPLVPIAGARMAGFDASWLAFVQLVPTVLLLVAILLLIDIALSDVVPGAYDNASGVAAALAVATELEREPLANLDLWIVLSGAEECNCEGMARWLAAHRGEIDSERTFFVNVDSVSYGRPHYVVSEGAVVSYPMDTRLVELCEAIAAADREENRPGPSPIRIPIHSDALPVRVRGFRAISVLGLEDGLPPPYYHTPQDTPERIDDAALTRAVGFTMRLARALDRDVGRSFARTPEPEPADATR